MDFRKAPLSLSGVVLGVNPALASAPRDFLAKVVPVAPTTQRTFLRGHRPTAFLRVYQGGKKPATAVTMVTSLEDEHDRTVSSAKSTLPPEEFDASRAIDHRFEVPVEDLAPGAYLLRFEASAGKETASRDVRFVVR
ncbi:hypothetical protein BH24ACI5_BH24ACI5_16230 [soil metagenome]